MGKVWCCWAAFSAVSIRERYVFPIRRLAKMIELINVDISDLLQEPDLLAAPQRKQPTPLRLCRLFYINIIACKAQAIMFTIKPSQQQEDRA